MRHAGKGALDRLADLLKLLREFKGLKEKKRGIFYRKSAAFLHFHEDPAGLFAHLHSSAGWERLPVNTMGEKRHLLKMVKTSIAECTRSKAGAK